MPTAVARTLLCRSAPALVAVGAVSGSGVGAVPSPTKSSARFLAGYEFLASAGEAASGAGDLVTLRASPCTPASRCRCSRLPTSAAVTGPGSSTGRPGQAFAARLDELVLVLVQEATRTP